MDIPVAIVSTLGIIAALGGIVAYFMRARGQETIKLLEVNIKLYQDAEKLKDQRIAYLEAQAYEKDQIIKKLAESNNGPTTSIK